MRPAHGRVRLADLAQEVLARHLGRRARRLERVHGGLNNTVFEAAHRDGRFVVRIAPSAARLDTFLKEQWCVRSAEEAGVPVPRILEAGVVADRAFMISLSVPGIAATHHPDRTRIVRRMGELLARLHTVRTRGFGHTFDWSPNVLSRHASWARYLERELDVDGRLAILARHRMLAPEQLARLRRLWRTIARARVAGVLNHGDMRLKNLIVDKRGEVRAVLDWEACISSAGPAWDLSIALHDLAIDDKEALLQGYGVAPARFARLAPVLRAFNGINYAPYVHQAAAAGDRERLAFYRLRLAGALDLYAI